MFKNKKAVLLSGAFLLIAVLINVLIIKIAYIDNQDVYWALLFSIPVLGFAIYKGTVSKKGTNSKLINFNAATWHGKNEVTLPRKIKGDELTVLFGNSHCTQPYRSSIICPKSMSAGENIKFMPKQITLSEDNGYAHDMIQRLNDNLFINDSTWRIEPDYAGCRDNNFKFNAEAFRLNALRPTVKMIELKLSHFNNEDTIPISKNYSTNACNSKYAGTNFNRICEHTAFSNAESMAIFLDSLRQLSGKKPIGLRLPITDKKEFHKICYAFRKTEIIPDYIVIEDCSVENILGMPLYEALLFASKTLEIYGLTKEIKIIAAAQIYTALDVVKLIALGADGIIMQNNHLPGNNKKIFKTSPDVFSQDYWQLRNEILRSTIGLINSLGYMNIKEITLSSLLPRLNNLEPINTDIDRVHFKGADQEKSFRIIKKAFTEQNRNTVISFN